LAGTELVSFLYMEGDSRFIREEVISMSNEVLLALRSQEEEAGTLADLSNAVAEVGGDEVEPLCVVCSLLCLIHIC